MDFFKGDFFGAPVSLLLSLWFLEKQCEIDVVLVSSLLDLHILSTFILMLIYKIYLYMRLPVGRRIFMVVM